MKIALVGCGYVADFYIRTLPNHGDLELVGVYDCIQDRLRKFADYYSVRAYRCLDELLEDEQVQLVVNLTNPGSHFAVSKVSLEAGKHVYSEKPLSMDFDEAKVLTGLADRQGLGISSAPCSLLGETAQTMWRALREEAIGKPRLVYASMDDGMIPRTNYREWRSESGSPWPWQDEFQVGCTLEHAGYHLTWLIAFFGPAKTVTSAAVTIFPEKGGNKRVDAVAPDFSSAVIEFTSGIVARLTCSIVAPVDRGFRIVGDTGVLSTKDCWEYGAPVYVRSAATRGRKKKLELVRSPKTKHHCGGVHHMDFSRGVAELAAAARAGKRGPMPADFGLHVNEITLAIQSPGQFGCPYTLTTSCKPPEPMPWSQPE